MRRIPLGVKSPPKFGHPSKKRFNASRFYFRYAPEALTDLEEATIWLIQPGSGPRAWRRHAAIRKSIERLTEHSFLWPVGQHEGVRKLPSEGGYRVLYEVIPDTGCDETAGDVIVPGPANYYTEAENKATRIDPHLPARPCMAYASPGQERGCNG